MVGMSPFPARGGAGSLLFVCCLCLRLAHTRQAILVLLPKLTNAPTKVHTGCLVVLLYCVKSHTIHIHQLAISSYLIFYWGFAHIHNPIPTSLFISDMYLLFVDEAEGTIDTLLMYVHTKKQRCRDGVMNELLF